MLIRLLCAHEMTKHVCKISLLNSKRLLRKLQKILGGYFILPHPVDQLVYTNLRAQFGPLASRLPRSLKVIGTYRDRSGVHDFRLVTHSNHGPVSYCL